MPSTQWVEEAKAMVNPLQPTPKVLLRGSRSLQYVLCAVPRSNGNVKNAYVTEVSRRTVDQY